MSDPRLDEVEVLVGPLAPYNATNATFDRRVAIMHIPFPLLVALSALLFVLPCSLGAEEAASEAEHRESAHVDGEPSNEGEQDTAARPSESSSTTPFPTLVNSIGMKLVRLPAGTFPMGSVADEKGHGPWEQRHIVHLTRSFYIGVTEVTQAQWVKVMGEGSNPSHFTGEQRPVETVTWEDANEFCRRLSKIEGQTYRLPTEAEWEYACRAGSTVEYHNGGAEADLRRTGWYGAYSDPPGNSGRHTNQVAQLQPNRWGLYDMHGNVWEWTADFFMRFDDRLEGQAVIDPVGGETGQGRTIKGGGWYSHYRFCRSAFRVWWPPSFADFHLGFRVVMDAVDDPPGDGKEASD